MARIVFIVQGEGRGHLSQALALSEYLEQGGHAIEAVYAGCNDRHPIPGYFKEHFNGKLRCFASPYFLRTPNKKGIYIGKTFLYQSLRIPRFLAEVKKIRHEITAINPDAVVNFYDLVGALAMRKLKIPGQVRPLRIGVGHHFFLHLREYPCGEGNWIHKRLFRILTGIILKSCDRVLALSFRDIPGEGKITVVPPLIRKDFREAVYTPGERGLVYLLNEGFIGDLISWAESEPDLRLDVFSELPSDTPTPPGIRLHPLDAAAFLEKMITCRFLITTSGFDTVAEAAWMGIPLVCIPVQNHFEQRCNSLDVEESGLGIATDTIRPGINGMIREPDNKRFNNWVKRADELFLKHITG